MQNFLGDQWATGLVELVIAGKGATKKVNFIHQIPKFPNLRMQLVQALELLHLLLVEINGNRIKAHFGRS